MRGRTDFEDSLISVRREEQAREKRRLQAMAEALKSRGLASDPDGSRFLAARQEAIRARRAENARLDAMAPPSDGFTISQLDAWDDRHEPAVEPARRDLLPWVGGAVLLACAALAASLLFPGLLQHLSPY